MTKLNRIQKLFLPSLIDVLLFSLFFGIFRFSKISSFDVWWHIKTGETVLGGVFPKVDIFSFTAAGREWLLHEWGCDVLFAFINNLWGLPGLMVLQAAVVTISMAIVYKTMRKRNVNIFLSVAIMLFVILGAKRIWVVRPHIFSMLSLTILAYWIYEYWFNGKSNMLYYMPILFIAWVNLHAGFVLGFVLLGIIIVTQFLNNYFEFDKSYSVPQDRVNKLFISSVVSFIACFINPNTYKAILYPFMYLGNKMPSHLINEWHPATMVNSLDFMIILFLFVVTIYFTKKRPRFFESAIIVVFIFWTLKSQRLVGYFSVLALPLMAVPIQSLITEYFAIVRDASSGKIKHMLNSVGNYISSRSMIFDSMDRQLNYHTLPIVGAIVLSILVVQGAVPSMIAVKKKVSAYPIETLEYLKLHKIEGNILNQYRWGGLLIYELDKKKVFIDGRMDVYQQDITAEYLKVKDLTDGWEEVINKYNITHVLLKKDMPFSRLITRIDKSWKLVVEDENSKLFIKDYLMEK